MDRRLGVGVPTRVRFSPREGRSGGSGIRGPRHGRRRLSQRAPGGRHRQHAPHLPLRRLVGDRSRSPTRSSSVSTHPCGHATAEQARLGDLPRPSTRRTTSSARWRATSAGTGARASSPRGSGDRCGWRHGRVPGWRRCGRQRLSPRRAKELSTSPPTSSGMALPEGRAVGVARRPNRGGGRRLGTRQGQAEGPVGGALVAGGPAVPSGSTRSWWKPCRRRRPIGWADDRVSHRRARHLGGADGTRFALVVNGERIWVRGFNWIPDDCFPARVDRGRYERRIADAVDGQRQPVAGVGWRDLRERRLLRSLRPTGVMVWQDFLFACAAYPEELRLRSSPKRRMPSTV